MTASWEQVTGLEVTDLLGLKSNIPFKYCKAVNRNGLQEVILVHLCLPVVSRRVLKNLIDTE